MYLEISWLVFGVECKCALFLFISCLSHWDLRILQGIWVCCKYLDWLIKLKCNIIAVIQKLLQCFICCVYCLRPSPNIRGRNVPAKKPAEPASKFRTPAARPSAQDAPRGRKSTVPSSRNAKVKLTLTYLCAIQRKILKNLCFLNNSANC